jgi:hypothetical protein
MADGTEAPTPAPAPAAPTSWWGRQSQKLKDHFAEFGVMAIIVYFSIFFATWAGFAIAIGRGIEAEGVAGDSGVVFGAWLATKATQPLRILATLAITPFVAAIWYRVRGRKPTKE